MELEAAPNRRVPVLPEKQTKTNLGVGMGVFLQLAGVFFFQPTQRAAIFGLVLILVSIPVFIWGCMNYAAGKGHSSWVGLAGLAGIIGLIVLVLLPDRDRQGSVPRLQLRKFVGSISLVAGFGIVVLGLWLRYLGDDVRLERLLQPWPEVCMLLGGCVIVGSLVFVAK